MVARGSLACFVISVALAAVIPATGLAATDGLSVTKVVDKTTADPNEDLSYTITVADAPSSTTGYSFQMSDAGCGTLTTSATPVFGTYYHVDPGESIVFTCQHTFDPAKDGNSYINTACADGYADQSESSFKLCGSATTTLASHSVSGTVFEDLNADGVRQAGEPALSGVVVYADLNGNGARDAGEPSSTSDAQGAYSLSVDYGTTTIRQETPSGATCAFPTGCAYTIDLTKTSRAFSGLAARPFAARAADPTGKDFGNWRPATVSGTVVDDPNVNGVRDAGESGLAGIQVYADLDGNGTFDQGEPVAVTSADGTYSIGGLKPGAYVIRHVMVQGGGRTCTSPVPECSHNVTLASNGAVTDRDFLDGTPAQAVLPSRKVAGTARLSGKTGCVRGAFSARVRGTQMASVTFSLDGRRVQTVKDPRPSYSLRVNVRKLRVGIHVVSALVRFRAESGTKNKTMRLSFQRCAAALTKPRFTG
jgi:hypothetical protein